MVVSARGRCGSERLVSVASSATTTSLEVLLEAGDELADTEVSDHGLEGLVVLGIDLLDLDLGLLGDEIHLSLSFLLLLKVS